MSYTVEITIADLLSPDSDVEMQMCQLPDPYDTVASAKEAAAAHIAGPSLQPIEVLYSVYDREGSQSFRTASSRLRQDRSETLDRCVVVRS